MLHALILWKLITLDDEASTAIEQFLKGIEWWQSCDYGSDEYQEAFEEIPPDAIGQLVALSKSISTFEIFDDGEYDYNIEEV
jgi:hypothetical protein